MSGSTVDRAGCRPVSCHRKIEESHARKPVHIAQISDLHIKSPGSLAYGRVDTAAALERCVAALNAFRPKPDFVVISGDLVDTPTPEEYQHLRRLLAPLGLLVCRHSRQSRFPRIDAGGISVHPYAASSGPLNQRIAIGGLDLLLLDSSVPGKPHGELDAPTLQWLEAMLVGSPDTPALVFPAPSAVRGRHLAHGPPESPQCRPNSQPSSNAIHACSASPPATSTARR